LHGKSSSFPLRDDGKLKETRNEKILVVLLYLEPFGKFFISYDAE
jgi:hypothetical protein